MNRTHSRRGENKKCKQFLQRNAFKCGHFNDQEGDGRIGLREFVGRVAGGSWGVLPPRS